MDTATIVIIGGGTAGITAAARLERMGARDIALIEPARTHYYQPLWTLVGGGRARASSSARSMRSVIPPHTRWIQDAATGVDPEARTVQLASGSEIRYGQLVVAPGIQLDWDGIPGLQDAVLSPAASSNYSVDLAPRTWELIRSTTSGTAVFTMPSGPVKCAGAPQKIAYLAADYWRSQGVLGNIDVHLVLGTPAMFKVPVFAEMLADTAQDYGITVHLASDVTSVDPHAQRLRIENSQTGAVRDLHYSMAHLVPPQSAPEWLAASPLADADGFTDVDPATLRHTRYPEVFGIGDASNLPTSKTGAAVRGQAPVLVENMLAAWQGRPLTARYEGYTSCPLTLSRKKLLLAEFGYDLTPMPSNPLPWPDTTRPLTDFNLLKRVGLPAMYWNFMLKGLA